MIDFGFDKIALIGAVALIVIGPEKLPRVARTVGHFIGKAQRYVADVKAEVNRSIELEDLKKMKTEFEDAASTPPTSSAPSPSVDPISLSASQRAPGSTLVPSVGEGVPRSRTFQDACCRQNAEYDSSVQKSSFWRDAKTNTRDERATRSSVTARL